MVGGWERAFSQAPKPNEGTGVNTLEDLRAYLDHIQITQCLLKPYFETPDYPLVEAKDLLPSFDADVFEYKNLPGFSLVIFDRPLNYFQEIFQFDILHSPLEQTAVADGLCCPLEQSVNRGNLDAMLPRLPRRSQEDFTREFEGVDITELELYSRMLPYLLEMERAHVISRDEHGNFHLSGVYGSLPSDLDTEIKRFGARIGKFAINDNYMYERNRIFVYQFFMELYGFPMVSERRTSAALFSRRLHRMDERFIVRVLGQSDRTLTTMRYHPEAKSYPRVDKIALVQVDESQSDAIAYLKKGRYFVDPKKRVVIIRVKYQQHKYDKNNVQQDRALSVKVQEIIHPVTGEVCSHLNIVKDSTNLFLHLNDIVRGEYTGHIIYKRNEVVINTDTNEKRLKFLYAWLSKHQRRIIGYSDEFYAKVTQVLDNYLNYDGVSDISSRHNELVQEVRQKYSYIQQARKVKLLEDLSDRRVKGKQLSYLEMLEQSRALLHDLKFEIVHYFEDLVVNVIELTEAMLRNRYLRKNFIEPPEDQLTDYGLDIRRTYRKIVALLDEVRSIRKSRAESQSSKMLKAS